MRFNRHIHPELRDILTSQYEEYVKIKAMSKREMKALREWVKDGHSVYENSIGVWAEYHVPVEFLIVYREEEYIRKQIRKMNPEESVKFITNYFKRTAFEPILPSVEEIKRRIDRQFSEEDLPF